MARKQREIGIEHLRQVCTLSEAARAWCKGRTPLKNAINRGLITAERIGRDWLIAIPSLEARYGKAINEIRR